MIASPPCLCSGAFTPDELRDQKSTGSAVKLGPLTPMNEITTSSTFAGSPLRSALKIAAKAAPNWAATVPKSPPAALSLPSQADKANNDMHSAGTNLSFLCMFHYPAVFGDPGIGVFR